MDTLCDLLSMPTPELRGVGRPRHDANPDDRRKHIECATAHVIQKVSVGELQVRYGLRSNKSVYRWIAFAKEYDDPQANIIRRWADMQKTA